MKKDKVTIREFIIIIVALVCTYFFYFREFIQSRYLYYMDNIKCRFVYLLDKLKG